MNKKDKPQIGISVESINLDEQTLDKQPDFDALPILPTRNLVLFPGVTISIALKRQLSKATAQWAYDNHQPIGVVCQKDEEKETPRISHLFPVGVIADVIKLIELPDGEMNAIVHAGAPFRLKGLAKKKKHFTDEILAQVKPIQEETAIIETPYYQALAEQIKTTLDKILPSISEGLDTMINTIWKDEGPALAINFLITHLPLDIKEKMEMLKENYLAPRAMSFLQCLSKQEAELELNAEIMQQVRCELDDEQRKQILQRQMDVIHDQLYGPEDEATELEKRADNVPMSEEARKTFDKELNKLRRYNPQNPDYSVLYAYLETLIELPWGKESQLNCDFKVAQTELDTEHCGLEKVKERILEQLAVLMHNPNGKAPILCLVGPPGVGKTSLGMSIAKALGREYQRVSFGGLHDEAEIRGHRRTYIGSMPGRIIQAMQRAGTQNPVLVLDEVDKIGADYKGDPSAALLEVLDPEQNCHFHDNYVDVDFDLSHVLFIATANTVSTIARPLLDRMEIINLSGYLPEEKVEIARKHLIRRIFKELDIKKTESFEISDEALNAIIDEYTGESGVRQLEKVISSIARKQLLMRMSGKKSHKTIEKKHLKDLLGLPPHQPEKYETNAYAGVVTGLAWTEVGGSILLAEASLVQGKGKSEVTGNLGNVMKESASIAYQWVRSHASQLDIDHALFDKYNLHLHFPEGAIPKDGPSAGITIATAIVSAFKQKRVKERLAMTGEITLRGRVLPVGGIKEKILAAKRAGITDIVLSADNRKDIEDIDKKYIRGLKFHYVDNALEVMRIAITDIPAENALVL